MSMSAPVLVSPKWLNDHLADPNVQVIENAWDKDSYFKAHISGAFALPVHPYLKKFTAQGERTQHVMEPEVFSALCHHLGLQRAVHYVLYDDYYGLFAARFRAVCRYYGLTNISILDGSWRGWIEQGFPVSSLVEVPDPGTDIVVEPQQKQFIRVDELLQIYSDPDIQLWDTRRTGEYSGVELTENHRQGHLPGALNLDWIDLLTDPTRQGGPRFFKSPEELERQLTDLGLSRDKTIITYCQSGNRATIGNLVLELLGYPQHRLYDASMGEWANLAETPVVCGTAGEEIYR
jgi:thiosulfate/3-mercaptopyruvate sulfurtransferase